MRLFKCPKCGGIIHGFQPEKCACGYRLPVIDEVYQFTDDEPISIDDNNLRWLGYEKVGENYEPIYALSYKNGYFGIFGPCA